MRKDELAKLIQWAIVVKKHGGRFMVLAPNGVKREATRLGTPREHRGRTERLRDGDERYRTRCRPAPHTDTAVESRDETYASWKRRTRSTEVAPDVGQLQKGGADAAQVVKDFLPITVHMHLKDFNGGEHFAGYCPLGEGKVDLKGILDTPIVRVRPGQPSPAGSFRPGFTAGAATLLSSAIARSAPPGPPGCGPPAGPACPAPNRGLNLQRRHRQPERQLLPISDSRPVRLNSDDAVMRASTWGFEHVSGLELGWSRPGPRQTTQRFSTSRCRGTDRKQVRAITASDCLKTVPEPYRVDLIRDRF